MFITLIFNTFIGNYDFYSYLNRLKNNNNYN